MLHLCEDEGVIEMRGRILRQHGKRFTDQIIRLGKLAGLQRDDAQKMQGIEIFRLLRKHMPIARGRLRERAGRVQGDGFVEGIHAAQVNKKAAGPINFLPVFWRRIVPAMPLQPRLLAPSEKWRLRGRQAGVSWPRQRYPFRHD